MTGKFGSQQTIEVPSINRPYSRGGPTFRWVYARWRQILAFADLLSADGRPSATKLQAFVITTTVLFTAVVNSLKGIENVWSWPMFWLLFLCCSIMFGRWGLDRFAKVMENKTNGMMG